jgi:hypothetical protein
MQRTGTYERGRAYWKAGGRKAGGMRRRVGGRRWEVGDRR